MELKEQFGRWYAEFYIVDESGRRRRVRKSTGVKVGSGARARRDSRERARLAAQQLAHSQQLEASGLRREQGAAKTLEQALAAAVRKGVDVQDDVLADVLSVLDPDLPTGKLAGRILLDLASTLVQRGHVQDRVLRALGLVHAASEAIGLPPLTMPSRADMMALPSVFDAYFEYAAIRPRTKQIYRVVSTEFEAWCADQQLVTAGQISSDVLAAFAVRLRTKPKQRPVAGGAVGEYRAVDQVREPGAANRDLRAMSAMMNSLRKSRYLPQLSQADIFESLAAAPTSAKLKTFLARDQIRHMLDSAAGAECSVFVRFMLLAGLRAAEGFTLEWTDLDLDNSVIRIDAEKTKTKYGRLVDLDVSPTVIPLLQALPHRGPYIFGGDKPVGNLRRQFKKLAAFPGLQGLRRTCATYLSCMPSYGIHKAALRCGHSVAVAERNYAGMVRVPPDVKTLEEAMGLPASTTG